MEITSLSAEEIHTMWSGIEKEVFEDHTQMSWVEFPVAIKWCAIRVYIYIYIYIYITEKSVYLDAGDMENLNEYTYYKKLLVEMANALYLMNWWLVEAKMH